MDESDLKISRSRANEEEDQAEMDISAPPPPPLGSSESQVGRQPYLGSVSSVGLPPPLPPSLFDRSAYQDGRQSSFDSASSLRLPPVPPPSPSGSFNGMGYVPQPNAARMAQSNPSLILEGFIQRFREIDQQYQLSIQPGLERHGSYDLGGFTPNSPYSQESLPGSESPGGVDGVPSSLERAASAASAASGASVATSISVFARSLPEISQADLTAAGISQEDMAVAVSNLGAGISDSEMQAAIRGVDEHIAKAEEISRLKSAVSGAASAANAAADDALQGALQAQVDEQNELLSYSENQTLLGDIDREFDELMSEIFNSRAAGACLFIIRKLNTLFGLLIRAIGAGLGFAIKYPKLALILMGLAYLQSSTCAFIINKTIKFVWWITSYLFGMTTAGQKIGQFINGIIAVYNWCIENGIEGYTGFMTEFNRLVALAENIQSNIDELKRIAESLGIDITELVQIVLSMRNAFGSGAGPVPTVPTGAGQVVLDMLGQFANGLGRGAGAAALTRGGPLMLQPGGGKRKKTRKTKSKTNKKRKSKTNKKRKSKSNKKGKTKTRRR